MLSLRRGTLMKDDFYVSTDFYNLCIICCRSSDKNIIKIKQRHVYTLITCRVASGSPVRQLYYVSIHIYRPSNAKFVLEKAGER